MLPVIAKIEKPQAIENLDEVIAAFDGFMVARGDLAVECPLEDVPFLQKQVVQRACLNAKPVIVGTQMLESMISAVLPHPRRGLRRRERGARRRRRGDAVRRDERGGVPRPHRRDHGPDHLPSEEHAIVSTGPGGPPRSTGTRSTCSGVIAKAAEEVAERVGAKYVVAFTKTGTRAPDVPARGPIPIPAFTPEGQVRSQLSLSWGVETFNPRWSSTPTRWSARSTSSCSRSGGSRGICRHHRRGPPGIPLHERAAHPPDGRRDQRGRPGYRRSRPDHRLKPISPSRRADVGPPRDADRLPVGLACQATSTRSSAAQHRPRMSAELFVNCHRG